MNTNKIKTDISAITIEDLLNFTPSHTIPISTLMNPENIDLSKSYHQGNYYVFVVDLCKISLTEENWYDYKLDFLNPVDINEYTLCFEVSDSPKGNLNRIINMCLFDLQYKDIEERHPILDENEYAWVPDVDFDSKDECYKELTDWYNLLKSVVVEWDRLGEGLERKKTLEELIEEEEMGA